MGFDFVEGFSRPDWKHIQSFVVGKVPKEERLSAWNVIAEAWLRQLAHDLGGDARIHESERFFCLSDLDPDAAHALLTYAESTRTVIQHILKEVAWSGYYGKHVLLIFADPDDYYSYVSYYYPEGYHSLSSGVFLREGYAHIAFPYVNPGFAEHVLVHELTHNLLAHLPIPLWLNEGLAVLIERQMSRGAFDIDPESVKRHAKHWNTNTIQEFWAGSSFHVPGESNELSYSLAEILIRLLSESGLNLTDFITAADYRDAGQDAAVSILGLDLGELVARFLGTGPWRPQRKAIAEILTKTSKQPHTERNCR